MNLDEFDRCTVYDSEKEHKKHKFNILNKLCKKGQIVLFGDSITEFFDERLLDGKSKLRIYNRGISGDTSNRLLERLDENVLSIAPAQIILLIGTNDFGVGADSDYVFGNIKETVERIKAALPGVNLVVQCIYPVNLKIFGCEPTRNKYIAEVNEWLRGYAKENDLTLLDLTELLSNEDGGFDIKYSDDGLHPSDAGNRAIAEALSEVLIEKI